MAALFLDNRLPSLTSRDRDYDRDKKRDYDRDKKRDYDRDRDGDKKDRKD